MRRSSRISSSTTCSRTACSTRRPGSTGSRSRSARTFPVYQPDVRVFEVSTRTASRLRCSIAITSSATTRTAARGCRPSSTSRQLLGTLPVIYNVANLPEARGGRARAHQLRRRDHHVPRVRARIARHVRRYAVIRACPGPRPPRISSSSRRSSTSIGPCIRTFSTHYARHYQTGEPMPAELAEKIRKAREFRRGLQTDRVAGRGRTRHAMAFAAGGGAAAESGCIRDYRRCARRISIFRAVPPRYRSSYFSHIWASGYSAGLLRVSVDADARR